jgi:uncharacterized protein
MHLVLDFNASYLAALLIGLMSSVHCVGMCGSIIGTLTYSLSPEIRNNKRKLLFIVFNYNLGRIISYALAGALVGSIETILYLPFAYGAGHRILQIFSAIIMTGAGLYLAGWFPRFAYIEKIGAFFWRRIEPYGRRLIPVNSAFHALLFGMVWGWLPCGLIYTALALAATTGQITHSALTMFAFGLGTLPSVIGVGIMTSMITRVSRAPHFKRVAGLALIVIAALAAFPELNPLRIQHIMSN